MMALEELTRWLKRIPKVDELIASEELTPLFAAYPRKVVIKGIRRSLERLRSLVKEGERVKEDFFTPFFLCKWVEEEVQEILSPSLRKVINATGVVIHTNLGRAPLPEEAIERIVEVARGYSNLEYDLEEGKRGLRYVHVEELLLELTGAEAAIVVNNNAGAVLLVLNTLAEGREVIVSRGELVEIGGAFRIPDVMARSGARLREVGTTNRTHPRDYEEAIGEETALLLKVHTSNYRIVGFTSDVPLRELVEIGKRRGVPVMYDLGSGLLVDLSPHGLRGEPTAAESLAQGADVVTFSGDKLLGGPQAGIVLGRKEIVERVRRNPLLRALRIDKLTLAALEATLRLYLDEGKAMEEIPVLRMISLPLPLLRRRAQRLKRLILRSTQDLEVEVVRDNSRVGGGAFPVHELPTWAVAVRVKGGDVEELEEGLRKGEPPVVARIAEDRVLLDLRTITEEELPIVAQVLRKAVQNLKA